MGTAWGYPDFFIDYIPMYNKFRAVSSILVIAEFTIPLLAIFALKAIIDKPEVLKQNRRGVIISFALTAGVALILAVAPGILVPSFIPARELAALQQAIPGDQLLPILDNLKEMRMNMVTSDAWASFLFICGGFVLLFLYQRGKLSTVWTVSAIAVLCIGEMWHINKRYLYDDMFVPQSARIETFQKTPTDEQILQDKSLDYRVLNFASNTFNENNTSYWHKSIGGYHAAKLRRYQEMIDHHIAPEMQATFKEIAAAGGEMDSVDANKFRILNMLNTKYFIFPVNQQGQTAPILNPYAYGNAWFVNNVKYVNNANEEIAAVGEVDLKNTAVADAKFKEALKEKTENLKVDSLSTIKLTNYEPNHLIYETSSPKEGVVVFSEIFYPGWQATIDGQPIDIARANYILRAVNVPAGKHTIEMRFDPKSLHVTEGIAYSGLALLIIGAIAGLWIYCRKKQ